MPRYRVTVRHTSIETVEADNPYMAAVVARDRHGAGVDIADVTPAVGRPAASSAKKTAKKGVKTRRPVSPETRAKLAANLTKARAVRAAKQKAVKKSTKKRATQGR
jgi:hypothetical protein